jgi:Tfp pilus assembly protein PilX
MNNRGGSPLIAVIMIAAILQVALAAISYNIRHTLRMAQNERERATALNLAEAGSEHTIAKINNSNILLAANNNINVFAFPIALGDGFYSAKCSSNVCVDTFWIVSTGSSRFIDRTIEVVATNSWGIPMHKISWIERNY